ncbi:TPA: hypothetical protein U2M59_002199 [Providencia stuartii]|nr:hypothetical protein [Providencia stuartii]
MSFIVYVVAVGFFIRWMIKHKEKFILNEESLHKQWLFRLAVIFPIISSLYFMVCLGSDYPFKHDADGYNNFLEINKFSLGILALSPILGAFVVYAHRSLQTFTQIQAANKQIETASKQLKEAERKNEIDIYLAKRKFIIEQFSSLKTENGQSITSPSLLYLYVFIVNNKNDKANKIHFMQVGQYFDAIDNLVDKIEYLKDEINEERVLTKGIQSDISYEVGKINKELKNIYLLMKLDVNDLDLIDVSKFEIFKEDTLKKYNQNLSDSDINYINNLISLLSVRILNERSILDNFVEQIISNMLLMTGHKSVSELRDSCKFSNLFSGDKLAAENQSPPE